MPGLIDLETYRRSADAFNSELTAEYYRHFAGLKDDYEIEPIYARHQQLFSAEAVRTLTELVARTPAGEHRRRLGWLLDFAVQGHIGRATEEIEAEVANREARLWLELDGERIGFREATVAQANEPNAGRRARIEEGCLELLGRELAPLYEEAQARTHATACELGYRSYRELCEQTKSLDLDTLHDQTAAFAAATRSSYPELLEPELQGTLGIGFDQLRRADLPRFFRAVQQDVAFPRDRLIASLTDTARGLGIELPALPGVTLDVEPRPNKSPRAFCAPVQTPGDVYLVISPVGGFDDYDALFHEAGHTLHFAHTDPGLSFEFRCLGDNAISECYAFLIESLTHNAEWLSHRLGVDDPEPIVSHARAKRLVYLRRYTGKLAWELELQDDGPDAIGFDALSGRYQTFLSDALQIPWPREPYLADVDPGFYCACYLRAWALESHLRFHLRDRFGPAWFESEDAGQLLQSLWSEGQRYSAEELLAQFSGAPLDFAALVADLGL